MSAEGDLNAWQYMQLQIYLPLYLLKGPLLTATNATVGSSDYQLEKVPKEYVSSTLGMIFRVHSHFKVLVGTCTCSYQVICDSKDSQVLEPIRAALQALYDVETALNQETSLGFRLFIPQKQYELKYHLAQREC